MILPFFHHLLRPREYPVTWLLVGCNVILLAVLSPIYFSSQNEIEDLLDDEQFLEAQAKIFSEMIIEQPAHFARPLESLARHVAEGELDATQVLGRLSLRNAEFMERAPAFAFRGDHVLYRNWQDSFANFADLRTIHPNYSMGISSLTPGYAPYLTYQFLHGGVAHLVINMLVLILVGSVVEPLVGSVWFLVLYLFCGMGAAIGFQFLSGATPVPLVGASGSIMGLFGVLCALRFREPLRFVWILPTSTFAGYIFLPVWIFVSYLLLSDVAGFIETEGWMGTGIAHAAHLSGFAIGLGLGFVIQTLGFLPPASEDPHRHTGLSMQLKEWFPRG